MSRKKLKIIGALAVLSLLGLLAACAGSRTESHKQVPEQVFRYADNQAANYPTCQAAYWFAEQVEQRTDGRIVIEVFPDAALGDELSVAEQVQLGTIDFARVSIGTMSSFNEELNVLQMPYLYTDAAQMWRVLDGEIGQHFLGNMSGYDLVGLCWLDAGARSFYSASKPITRLEDLQGMVIRVQESDLYSDMVRALGGQPTSQIYSQVYNALQSGEIDAAENNWSSYVSTGHYEVAHYFVRDEHTRIPEMVLMSAATMSRLDAADQVIIRQAARECAEYERTLWVQSEAASEEAAIAAGVVVCDLAAGERERFRAAMEPLYDQYCADNKALIAAIRAS